MTAAAGVILLLSVVIAVSGLARRWRLSAPLLLVIVGLIGSYLPFIPEVELNEELVLVGLLPPILYATAIRTSLIDFRSNRRPIALLSVGLVLFTAFGVALVAYWLLPIPLAAAFALGAVVAPPDAVAATAIARRVGMPRRIVAILEGESLVNDATAIVALRTAIAALGGTVSVFEIGADFAIAAGGGVLVGIAVAFVIGKIRRYVQQTALDTSLSLITPFVSYLAAEEIHASGVLAVVVTGLLLGHKAQVIQNATSRISERHNWQTIQFLLENSVFLLIGLQVRWIVTDVADSTLGFGRIALACGAILITVMVLRPLWVFPATYLPRKIRSLGRADPAPAWQYPAVVSWAGMRGVVTLAAAFVLPETVPHREILILAALVVTAGTLLVQGFTLPRLVRMLGLRGPDRREDTLQEAALLQEATRAGLAELDKLAAPDDPEDIVELLRTRTQERSRAAWERLGQAETETPTAAYSRLRQGMLLAERARVLELRSTGRIPEEVLRNVLESFDIEESVLETLIDDDENPKEEELMAPRSQQEGCDHLAAAPVSVAPRHPGGCEDCLREGTRWVHLRLCLSCGKVACCDSSPRRHAATHYRVDGHPVVRSIEPGEGWRWCYVDSVLG
jgi:CPA1 family monovalent cation:H+ antiporter